MKHPAKLRITLKAQQDYFRDEDGNQLEDENGERITFQLPPLGFANVYDPHTKAYAKREKTQDEWAYGGGYGCHPMGYSVDEDGKYWITRSTWELKKGVDPSARWERGSTEPITTHTIVPTELQPIIIDNVPLEGFRIQHSVSRYGTSNKLWRVLDPRGFELEITTGTMEDLVMGGVIDKGLIVGPCIWRTGKILVRV